MPIEQTGEEIIKEAIDRIDNAKSEVDRIATAMIDLGIGAGGDLMVAWREILGAVSEARRGLKVIAARKEDQDADD